MKMRIRSLVTALLRRRHFEDAMRTELRFHIDAFADDLIRSGVDPAEAQRRATLEFGAVESVKEDCRQARGLRFFDELRQDARYAVRTMARAPILTAAAVLSLALGIGANTAIFGLIDAVFLRTLPVHDAHELYYFAHNPGEDVSANYPLFERYQGATTVFSGVTAYMGASLRVSGTDGVEPVAGQFVSGNYHQVLGVRLAAGRGFSAESDRDPSDAAIAVLSDAYWARRFGRSPDAIGRTLTIGGRQVTIVGVTAPGFNGLQSGARVDVTLPMSFGVLDAPGFLDDHSGWVPLSLVGRLQPGATAEQARAAADLIFQQYMREPEQHWARATAPERYKTAAILPAAHGSEGLRRRYATPLLMLMGMVGVVLLIACANVANLLLARTAARAKEVAVRVSIGASRLRLVRQLLTEGIVLAACGGALGLLVSTGITAAILSLFEAGPTPLVLDERLSGSVLAFTLGLSTLTGIGFGLAPAVRASRMDAAPALKGAGNIAGRKRPATAQILVIAQIALCTTLIATAALLGRSLLNLRMLDAGFDHERVLLFRVDMRERRFSAGDQVNAYSDMLDRLGRLPGVLSASSSTRTPIDASSSLRRIVVPGFEARALHGVSPNTVTPGYFETFGIRVLRGRSFTLSDTGEAPKVAIVSESMARFYFGSSDPIGRTFVLGSDPDSTRIVGIVEDVRHEQLRDDAAPKMVYTPLAQSTSPAGGGVVTMAVRTSGEPGALAATVRSEVRRVNANAMVSYVRTMDEQLDAALIRERLLAALSTGFGALALLLACVGLYGTMSYGVIRRSREIGVRLALGAQRGTILRQVLRESLRVAGTGVVIGSVAALWATKAVSTILFGLSPGDPVTLTAVAATLLLTALAASYLPARRAANLDPIRVLRSE
jgi:predicted permease